MEVQNMSFEELAKAYSLEPNTVDFLGHAIALYTDDSFLKRNCIEVIEKIQLYIDSAGRFGDSPFIYPIYGLSGIPEAFSRKSAVYGGVYMLNVTLKSLTKSSEGYELVGEWEGEVGRCTASKVIIHPSYLKELGLSNLGKTKVVCRRSICIVDQPINGIGSCNAVQLILPQNQTKRKNDIYLMMIGPSHGVCKKGFFIVIISSIKEKESFDEDLKVAFDLIGKPRYRFDLESQ